MINYKREISILISKQNSFSFFLFFDIDNSNVCMILRAKECVCFNTRISKNIHMHTK